ncbi:MAG TPA: hypothetical protein VFQ61_27120 [Polyangiaceae bacterium]|nr:hypothetical protein [Polyangiaceae bacterium]
MNLPAVESLVEALFSKLSAERALVEYFRQRIERLCEAVSAHDRARHRETELALRCALASVDVVGLGALNGHRSSAVAGQLTAVATDIQHQLDALEAELGKPLAERTLTNVLVGLSRSSAQLARLELTLNHAPSRLKLWLAPLCALPAIGVYLIGMSLRVGPTGLSEREQALTLVGSGFPAAEAPNVLAPEVRRAAFKTFSRAYFSGDLRAQKRMPLRYVLSQVLSNRSHADSLMLSAVSVDVRFHSAPFPWKELPTEPQLQVSWTRGKFELADEPFSVMLPAPSITNVGDGPAVGFHCEFQTATKQLPISDLNDTLLLLDSPRAWDLDVVDASVHGRNIRGGELSPPVYVATDVGSDDDLVCGRTRYRKTSNPDDLCRATECARNEPFKLTCEYQSLRTPEVTRVTYEAPPDPSVILFRATDRVRLRPSCSLTGGSSIKVREPWQRALEVAEAAISEPPRVPTPEGEPLIVKQLELDVANLESGGVLGFREPVHRFLRAKGLLALELSLTRPRNGSYTVTVHVGADQVAHRSIEVLVPEDLNVHEVPLSTLFRRFGRPELLHLAALESRSSGESDADPRAGATPPPSASSGDQHVTSTPADREPSRSAPPRGDSAPRRITVSAALPEDLAVSEAVAEPNAPAEGPAE